MTACAVLEALVSLSVQVALLICLVAWAVRNKDRSSADWCWATLHVCILALTAAAFLLPHVRLITWSELQAGASSAAAVQGWAIAGRTCGWVWLSGTIAMISVCVGGMFRATALVRNGVASDDLNRRQIAMLTAHGLATYPAEVRISRECISPFCWQLHQPVVLLPELVLGFPTEEQSAIVRHELAHLRLQHPLHLFLQRLVEAVYWFHPLVWWASRQAAAAREFRCDREAVRTRREAGDYLRSLLRLIEAHVKGPSRLPAGLGFLGDTSLLSRRAAALAERGDEVARPAQAWRPTLALAVAVPLGIIVWLPVNPLASQRAGWSPWPPWSARALDASGITVRDYEVDGHRLRQHPHYR